MGSRITFPSNGSACEGYLAGDGGPGIVVIQEWWGLVPHIEDVCERFAREGFVALAPDLYHGETTTEPDEAMKLAMGLEIDGAARDMSGAVGYLRDVAGCRSVGCVGYCMGGALSLVLGTIAPVDAVVPYYGLPTQGDPDWTKLTAAVQGHYAERDGFFPPSAAKEQFDKLAAMGRQTELHVYEADHGFFNDDNPGVHDPEAAKLAWERTLAFFRAHL